MKNILKYAGSGFKILGFLAIGSVLVAGGYGVINNIIRDLRGESEYAQWLMNRNKLEREVEAILDTNKNGLEPEEVKRFYDEIGFSPYTRQGLDLMPEHYLQKFLDLHKHNRNP